MGIYNLMRPNITHIYLSHLNKSSNIKYYHGLPFLDFYEKTTGQTISNERFQIIKKKHPNIEIISYDRLQCTLQILKKFGITPLEACKNMHIFSMNPITMDNYGEILKECQFIQIIPEYIIKYHTIVKAISISELKHKGLINANLKLEEVLLNCFHDWPSSHKSLQSFPEDTNSILTIRMNILERYLNWKLSVSSEDFHKYCRNYLPLKHKPMSDIQEAVNIAQKEIKFNLEGIKRNGFIISADPTNTKLIIENVTSLAGLDIREAIRIEPAILKNNYNALIRIRDLLEEYRISMEAQRRCLKIYCMCPETVQTRLEELRNLKEYQVLSTNPRVLSMVVHQKKMMNRLMKIQEAKKQCYSLNHLVSSSKVFNNYINSFGDKVCGRDIAILIGSSLLAKNKQGNTNNADIVKRVLKQLKRHKYWLHSALDVIDKNLHFLRMHFNDNNILNNCQILLYPVTEVEHLINMLLKLRDGDSSMYNQAQLDTNWNILSFCNITDDQILSLVLYQIEIKYHFSGNGIWSKQDGGKSDAVSFN